MYWQLHGCRESFVTYITCVCLFTSVGSQLLIWNTRFPDWLNLLQHMWHSYDFSPLWMRWCFDKSEDVETQLWHKSNTFWKLMVFLKSFFIVVHLIFAWPLSFSNQTCATVSHLIDVTILECSYNSYITIMHLYTFTNEYRKVWDVQIKHL